MKRFLLHVFLFSLLFGAFCFFVFSLADGETDEYYIKFTTPKQFSLIIGSSRAAQGIQPKVLNEVLQDSKLYNYAFSRVHSPYGKAYYNNIKRKLEDSQSKRGVFIIEVNPWTLSCTIEDNESEGFFYENNSFINKVDCVDCNPNLEYLILGYQQPYYNLLYDKIVKREEVYAHIDSNGWSEVLNIGSNYNFEKAENNTIEQYQLELKNYTGISVYRLDYLKQTICFLQQHGRVFLVRMPLSKRMLALEDTLIIDFDMKMQEISKLFAIDYLNFTITSEKYRFIDGHHLDFDSGQQISKYIANHINKSKSFLR